MEQLMQFKQAFYQKLAIFFDKRIAEAPAKAKEMLLLLKEFSMRGGKRIRPALLYHGYACFAKPNDEVLTASLSIELVQSYFLIHDDIMDKDDLRRNGPTIHKSYENIFQKKRIKDAKHLGLSLAICAGDLACALANQILA